MGFLNPWVLAGLAAVGVPIAIHLINKFRVQKTRWAAMRFLQESLQRNRRRLQIEDLILLILRCLVVVSLVLAFALPVFREKIAAGASLVTEGAATAVLLDNSASMAQSNGVSTRFEEGKNEIRALLEKLPLGAPLAFFLVNNRADALLAKPVTDIPRFRRSLDLAVLTDRSTDLPQGVRAAAQALSPFAGQPREILLFTDSQIPAWRGGDAIRQIESENPGLLIKPMILGKSGEANLAIVGLQSEGGVPTANLPCRVRVDVANFGEQAAKAVRVTVAVDGGAPSDETLIQKIEPGATQSVTLYVRLGTPGFHSITANIPPDRLPVDNERALALQAVSQMNVLIAESNTSSDPSERDGYFLANALAPISSDEKSKYFLKLRTVPYSELAQAPLSSMSTVFLCNPGALSDKEMTALEGYVRAGGNLVIFPGEKTDPNLWAKNAAWSNLLPAILEPMTSKDAVPIGIQPDSFTHPITSIWANADAKGGLSAVRYTQYFPMKLRADSKDEKASSILNLTNGSPAVAEWRRGMGRVVLFNAPAIPRGNNLVLHPGFVALMQRLVGYLNRETTPRLVLSPGETFELPVAMELLSKNFSVIRPGKDEVRRPAGRVELSDARAVIRFKGTDKVGAYRLFIGDETQPSAIFAVQMDPKESDLRQAAEDKVKDWTRPTEVSTQTQSTPTAAATSLRVTREFWLLFILLAALFALAEAVLAHHMSRSR